MLRLEICSEPFAEARHTGGRQPTLAADGSSPHRERPPVRPSPGAAARWGVDASVNKAAPGGAGQRRGGRDAGPGHSPGARVAHPEPPQVIEVRAGRRIGEELLRRIERRAEYLRHLDDFIGGGAHTSSSAASWR
jgi:hypothetical protein